MKEIVGFPGYFATEEGEIISVRSGGPRLLVKQVHKGYYHVFIKRGIGRKTQVKIPVHQLVLIAHKGAKQDESKVCRHLDGNCFNNKASNLEWGTISENAQDSIRHGTAVCLRRGADHPCAKIKPEVVLAIKKLITKGLSNKEIALLFNLKTYNIRDIRVGKAWEHLTAV